MTTFESGRIPLRATDLDRLLRPRSVVIVGASDKPGSLGASVLANLERQDYCGKIYLINPKRSHIGVRPCLASIERLPLGVDAAVLAIPGVAVLDAVTALAARNVGSAIIFSAGFAEGGAEGATEQNEIASIARDAGMIIEGPNCLGLINFVDAIPLTFVELPLKRLSGRPGLAIVSQSGAMAAVLGTTLLSRDVGLSYSISTGNEAASGVEDYVERLVDDPNTRVIAMIVEQFRKPSRFLAIAEKVRLAGKSVVLLHPGKSSAARESAATHTGAMAGDYKIMAMKVERAGVILADTLEELGDISEILLRCPPTGDGGTIVIGESGAYKALTLDLAEEEGLKLAAISDQDSPELREVLPEFVPVSNPLDITAQGLSEPNLYRRILSAVIDDDRFGSVLVSVIQTDPFTAGIKFPPLIAALQTAQKHKPVVVAGLDQGALVPGEFIDHLRMLHVPYFPAADRVVRAFAKIQRRARRVFSRAPAAAPRRVNLPDGRGVIPEYLSKSVLAAWGIPFLPGKLVTRLDQAATVASEIGFPVVIKAQSADLPHKSEAGGVIVGLENEDALSAGWEKLANNIAHHRPGMTLDGVLVEAMGKRGIEFIVGARNDPQWGPVVLVGVGGIQAELLQDARLLSADLTEAAILEELDMLKCQAILHGFRGSPPLDIGALTQIVRALGQVMLDNPTIREVDLNPVTVYPRGEGAVALDALILAD